MRLGIIAGRSLSAAGGRREGGKSRLTLDFLWFYA